MCACFDGWLFVFILTDMQWNDPIHNKMESVSFSRASQAHNPESHTPHDSNPRVSFVSHVSALFVTMEDFDEMSYYLRPSKKNRALLGGILLFVMVAFIVSGWLQSVSAEYSNVCSSVLGRL